MRLPGVSARAVILRASDNAEEILFSLPTVARESLVNRFRAAGIPPDVIEALALDIHQGLTPPA